MDIEGLPERNMASSIAKTVFYEEVNDIDIYVEDTARGYEKIYKELFFRAFSGRYRVYTVFPVGNRAAVLGECHAQQGGFSRPSLFVIDGDIFLMHGDAAISLSGLFILPVYCIENILVDADAFHKLLNEEDVERDAAVLAENFDFNGWASGNGLLLDLFIEYAVSNKLTPDIQTVAFSVRDLVSSNTGVVDPIKIKGRIEALRQIVIDRVGESAYDSLREEITLRISSEDAVSKYVSGKDYLLPLLTARFKSIVKTKIPNINFKLRLAMSCKVDELALALDHVAM